MSFQESNPCNTGAHGHRPLGPWQSDEHRPREKRHLLFTLLLTSATMVLEIIGGLLSGSLALLSDAGHMFSHAFSLLISYSAIVIASHPASDQRSYGLYRVEVLAALVNSLTIFAVAGLIIYEGVDRFLNPISIATTEMFVIALIGLVVNLVSAAILWQVRHGDLNVKSAFAHMMSDTISSIGVVACAILIYYTGWRQADALVSLAIAVIILFWGYQLLRDSVNILLETTPKHIKPQEVVRAICDSVPEISQVHDIHIWEITSQMYTMTAHALIEDLPVSRTHDILLRTNKLLRERFNICHTNIQFECIKETELKI